MAFFDLFADSLIQNGNLNSFRSQRKKMANKVMGFDLSSNKVLFYRINQKKKSFVSPIKNIYPNVFCYLQTLSNSTLFLKF